MKHHINTPKLKWQILPHPRKKLEILSHCFQFTKGGGGGLTCAPQIQEIEIRLKSGGTLPPHALILEDTRSTMYK